jgi:hypothetical protein
LLVTSGDIQDSATVDSLLLIENKSAIRCAQETVCEW